MHAGLRRADLDPDPWKQLEHWVNQAMEADLWVPNAMQLATATAGGAPSLRNVLLKYFDQDGLVFYTNYGSRKAREIGENDQVAALLTWLECDRQVKFEGRAEKISAVESLKYFASRPRGSRLAAWCSHQSEPISSRAMLEEAFEKIKRKFGEGEIPLPDFWGGYRIRPQRIEFWQGREKRLHDSFEYRSRDAGWDLQRLQP